MRFFPLRARPWLLFLPLLILGLVVLLSRRSSVDVENGNTPAQPSPAQVASSVDSIKKGIDALKGFETWRAQFAAGEAALAEGVRLAEARRDQLFELIQSDPEAALAAAVSYADRQILPPEVVAMLETPVSTAADLDVWQACGGPGQNSSLTRWLHLEGEKHQVFTFGERSQAMSKNRLSVHGIAIDGRLALSDDPVRVLSSEEKMDRGMQGLVFQAGVRFYQADSEKKLAEVRSALLESESTLGPEALPAYRELALGQVEGGDFIAMQDGSVVGDGDIPPNVESAFTEGAKTMLYIRARFADEDPAYEPVSLSTAQTRQGESEAFWFENSYGKSSLSTTFTDVVTLPKNGSEYVGNFGTLRNDAAAAAVALNANWNRDTHDFYTIVTNSQSNPSFGYAGVAQLNNKGSHLLRQYISVRTASHEYGHNLGLNHSAYWLTDSPSPIGEDSNPGGYVGDAADNERIEYGHKFAVMGAQNGSGDFDSGRAHFTASNKNRLDWLVEGDGDIATTTTGGTFRLYRHDVKQADFASMTTGVPRAIKIDVPSTDPTGFSNPYKYWLNYRLLPTNGIAENWLPHGIQVDWRRDGNGFRAVQLDMTPYSRDSGPYGANPSTNSDNNDKEDGVLLIGRTFSDVGADIHFTAIGEGGTNPNEWLDVVVNVGTQATNSPPEIQSFTASATQVGTGENVTFSVDATDPDSGDTLAYHWDLGDNTVQSGQLNNPTRTKQWSNAGFYVMRAEVSDMKGGKATESVVIQVGNPTNQGMIHGRVTQSGRPVEGAFVRGGGVETWTDSDGTYVLAGVATGSVPTVTVTKAGLTFTPRFTNPVQVTQLNAFGIDFTADQPWSGGGGNVMAVVPFEIEVPLGASVPFSVEAFDGSGDPVPVNPSWAVDGGGSISTTGEFTASSLGGPFTVTATDLALSGTARVTVIDSDAVGVVALDASAAEPADNGVFRVRRFGSTAGALTVQFSVSGTATTGADYSGLGTSVVIPDGASFTDVTVAVIDDFVVEPLETVILNLQPDAAYTIYGSEAAATVEIADDGDVAPVATITRPSGDAVAIPSGVGLELEGHAADDGLPGPLALRWRASAAPAGATVRFSPPSGTTTTAFFSTEGIYQLDLVAFDGANESTDTVTVFVGADGTSYPDSSSELIRYAFDESSGATAGDAAGGDDDGTLFGNPQWESGESIAGNSIAFDGVGDSVGINNTADINTAAQGLRTIALWFKAANPTLNAKQVLYEEGGGSRGLSIYLSDGNLYIAGWNNGENGWPDTYLSTPLTDTGWHHAALVLNADGATSLKADAFFAYLDGVEFGRAGAAIINPHTGAIGIGAKRGDTRYHDGTSSGTGDYFAGLVDNFHLYNRALSPIEIGQLFAWGNPAPAFTLPGVSDLTRAIILPSEVRLLLDATATGNASWSQLSGPSGQATFGDPAVPSTWVSFATPGYYDLRLRSPSADVTTALQIGIHAGIDAPALPATSNQVIYYSLDENTGTIAGDGVGSDDDGTLANGPVWVPGISGSGLLFDGVDDVVEINNRGPINTSNSYTQKSIAFWFKPAATGTGAKEVLFEEGGTTRGLCLYLDGDILYGGGWNNGTLGWDTTHLASRIRRDEWNHVVLTLDVAAGEEANVQGLKLYVDGCLAGAGYASEMQSHSGNVGLGAMRASTLFHDGNGNGDGLPFAGVIDEFHYFNDRVLTLAEIGGLCAYGNIAAQVDAGPDQPDVGSLIVTLAPMVVDDGGAGVATTSWTITEGPSGAGASFDQPDANGVPSRGIFTTEGYHRLRLSAFDGQATTFDEMQLSVSDGPNFTGWLGGHFELSGDDLLPTANTDNDPFNQFYEYATGGNPTGDDDPLVLGPASEVTDDSGDDFFELTYRRRRDYLARNLIYEVEFSDSMAPSSWDTAMGTEIRVDPVNAEIELVTVRFSDAIGGGNTRQFARLSIREGP